MREQSHIDDMRAAIRGDRERARARRQAELAGWQPVPRVPALESAPAPPPEPEAEVAPEPEVAPDPAERRSRWPRLLRRS